MGATPQTNSESILSDKYMSLATEDHQSNGNLLPLSTTFADHFGSTDYITLNMVNMPSRNQNLGNKITPKAEFKHEHPKLVKKHLKEFKRPDGYEQLKTDSG